MPLRPIDQQQLILSIKTPLARDDLLGQDQEIKPQQKMAFFFVPSSSANSEVKSAWDLGEGSNFLLGLSLVHQLNVIMHEKLFLEMNGYSSRTNQNSHENFKRPHK